MDCHFIHPEEEERPLFNRIVWADALVVRADVFVVRADAFVIRADVLDV
jgi:hypothetical protein